MYLLFAFIANKQQKRAYIFLRLTKTATRFFNNTNTVVQLDTNL